MEQFDEQFVRCITCTIQVNCHFGCKQFVESENIEDKRIITREQVALVIIVALI